MKSLNIHLESLQQAQIKDLQTALHKSLKFPIEEKEMRAREFGPGTVAALKAFQKQSGLPADGALNVETLAKLNEALSHAYQAANKTRTRRLQEKLELMGYAIHAEERNKKAYGKQTQQSVIALQSRFGMEPDGKLTEAFMLRLEEEALMRRLSDPVQINLLHRTLKRAARVSKIPSVINEEELENKTIGTTTQEVIKAFQGKYKLPVSGELDALTYERLLSVAASQPMLRKKLKPAPIHTMGVIKASPLRLNKKGESVGNLQKALAYLGYSIDESEYKALHYGPSTKAAVFEYQKKNNLPPSGAAEPATIRSINTQVIRDNPEAIKNEYAFRVRGSVRNEAWNGMEGFWVEVYEKRLQEENKLLAKRQTFDDGFFDIAYNPPLKPENGQIKTPFQILVRFPDLKNSKSGKPIERTIANPKMISWCNYTAGDEKYQGISRYEQLLNAIKEKSGKNIDISRLTESLDKPDISYVAHQLHLKPEDVMRLVLSHLAADNLQRFLPKDVDTSEIDEKVFYAFIGQYLPLTLPPDLMEATNDWEQSSVNALVFKAISGILLLNPDLQEDALKNAAAENLIPIATTLRRTDILTALATIKMKFVLDSKSLTGNGSLSLLLKTAGIKEQYHESISQSFIEHQGLTKSFWTSLQSNAATAGGEEAVKTFKTVADLGYVSMHNQPMMDWIIEQINGQQAGNAGGVRITRARDCAKKRKEDWIKLIGENNIDIPDYLLANPEIIDPVGVYAEFMERQSTRLFPATALFARTREKFEQKQPELLERVFDHDDFEPDKLILNSQIKTILPEITDEDSINLVRNQARILQRIYRLTDNPEEGAALLDAGIHSSFQIINLGKANFLNDMKSLKGGAERVEVIFTKAEFQYSQTLQLLLNWRFGLNSYGPQAITSQSVTDSKRQEVMGEVPDLETLFGSLDYCECQHCQSVYSPSAYLTDLMRWLNTFPLDSDPSKKVLDVLLKRRIDIQNLNLNCDNTEVSLPYIDLVNEILEHNMLAPAAEPDFAFQTTLSKKELRAFPENVRRESYDLLRKADYPMTPIFDLWQEEPRMFLNHLGVPRHSLMKAFQRLQHLDQPGSGQLLPSNESIAGESFQISSHETKLIISDNSSTKALQDVFWGDLDTSSPTVVLHDFLRVTDLSYEDFLTLLQVRWISDNSLPMPVAEIPSDSCDTKIRVVGNLTLHRYDRIHRFLRLWRHTKWAMWELDLLIRSPKIGRHTIDGQTLVRLQEFKKIQDDTGLSFEQILSFFSGIILESRFEHGQKDKIIKSQFETLFLNQAVLKPDHESYKIFKKILDSGGRQKEYGKLESVKPILLAAFSIKEKDLDLVIQITNGTLDLYNLSIIFNYITLKKGLNLSIKDLLIYLALSKVKLPVSKPKSLLACFRHHNWIKKSGFSLEELEYLLQNKPDSPIGLRKESIIRCLETIRNSLRETEQNKQSETPLVENATSSSDGNAESRYSNQIKFQIATFLGIDDIQSNLLLEELVCNNTQVGSLFLNKSLTEKIDGSYTPIDENNFKDLINAFVLLHKSALILKKMSRVEKDDAAWLFRQHKITNSLDWNTLPINEEPKSALFYYWLRLMQWVELRSRFPEPEGVTWRSTFEAASSGIIGEDQLLDNIAKLTNWNRNYLKQIKDGQNLKTGTGNSFSRLSTYFNLSACFDQINRLGVSASTCFTWTDRDGDANEAQFLICEQVRQASKAKYDYDAWLGLIVPFQDDLREKKRKALVSWQIAFSQKEYEPEIEVNKKLTRNPKYFLDSNDALNYYLIDVEMSSCMLTSRIKQAISSVQMFVQRCFLNLEKPEVVITQNELADTNLLDNWSQWKWMKNYRVWEANRKVFLYPENWIEPELRDDKSPFFKELEREILQNEITHEHVEGAFLNYLHKVHEVSRLQVVGVYNEVVDNPLPGCENPSVNLLHVVGRTTSDPAVYYYRKYDLNNNIWSAWEKIDLDIISDHCIPVVYNRKVYVFWLNLVRKPQKVRKTPPAQPSAKPSDPPDAPEILEIRLMWSNKTKDGWAPKKTSRQVMTHPWPRPNYSYNLKSRYKSKENQLWLDIYISTSKEFNQIMHYDPYSNSYVKIGAAAWDEKALPWHSSSFVFDGDVFAVKMKGIKGSYHPMLPDGKYSDDPVKMTSIDYLNSSFNKEETAIGQLSGPYETAPRLLLPAGMHFEYNLLANNAGMPNQNRLNILEGGESKQLLRNARTPYNLAFSRQDIQFDISLAARPFFYQDKERSFMIKPEWRAILSRYDQSAQTKYTFYPFYHPYTALFIRELNRGGLDGLLNRRIQVLPETYYQSDNKFQFSDYQNEPKDNQSPQPVPWTLSVADDTVNSEIVDFSRYGAYSIYNWELFFHAPLLIANRLMQNQRFEEALRWFHYIFDPTNVDGNQVPKRFWVTKPFFEMNEENYADQRIDSLLKNINDHIDELREWKNNPFKPHLIARWRPVAYQKKVVMKYLDNLIAWGDQLFRRDTIESINQATQLYVLAYEILGRRPKKVSGLDHKAIMVKEILQEVDVFANDIIEVTVENLAAFPVRPIQNPDKNEPLPKLEVSYFCLPANEMVLGYWDKVEDRLYKIRHCMNIEGVVRQLPLFEPPIDPALLVKAAAAGVDIDSVMNDTYLPSNLYRFRLLVQKAVEFCAEVKGLGDKILSAIEKRDAEGLALLRSTQEIGLHKAVKEVKIMQITEAKQTLAGLEFGVQLADKKIQYYAGIPRMNDWEVWGVSGHLLGIVSEILATICNTTAGAASLVPEFEIGVSGFGGSPEVTIKYGGKNVADSSMSFGALFQGLGAILHSSSNLLEAQGSYTRRHDENQFQKGLAEIEQRQILKQIEASNIRVQIAQKELDNQDTQIAYSEAADEYMRSKYSNQQLYSWMLDQLATVYFQSYQLAYDLAKRAERAYQFELGARTSSFIQFGYWDSLKKGLLAGEKLSNDLRRLEAAYLENNRREMEITKHISLAQIFPLQLQVLKATGSCTIKLDEWMFDLDYPGHYCRRIKTVAISVPCVAGPYTSVNCILTLTNNAIRMTDDVALGYGDPFNPDSERFMKQVVPNESIVTSHGQNDAGVFELNMNDERYLPFEGDGVVSEWQIDLPKGNNQFDFSSISDFILHLKYTARQSSTLKTEAIKNYKSKLPTIGLACFSLKHEFPTEWHRFITSSNDNHEFSLNIEQKHLPFIFRSRNPVPSRLCLLIDSKNKFDSYLDISDSLIPSVYEPESLVRFFEGEKENAPNLPGSAYGEWKFKILKNDNTEGPVKINNLFVVFTFSSDWPDKE